MVSLQDKNTTINPNLPVTDKQFMAFVQSWSRYLREYNYTLTPDCVLDFYRIINQIEILNIDEFCGISKSLFSKNQIEFDSHDDFFDRFIHDYMKHTLDEMAKQTEYQLEQKMQRLSEYYQQQQQALQREEEARLEKLLAKLMGDRLREIKNHRKLLESISPDCLNQLFELSEQSVLNEFLLLKTQSLTNLLQDPDEFPYPRLKNDLNTLMRDHIMKVDPPSTELNNLLITAAKTLQKIHDELKKEERQTEKKYKERQSDLESQRLARLQEEEQQARMIIKNGVLNHRQGDFAGKNSVLDISNIQDQVISDLGEAQYQSLLSYIQSNAAKFRTKLARSMKQSTNKVFDYKATIRNSIKTFGIPMKLHYKRRVIKKYKLVCFLDVSGSVSHHLKLLTSFLYEINSVFSGGVYTFGFVSELLNFSAEFQTQTVDQVIKIIDGRRGYSNYYRALKDFYEQYLSLIDGDTIVLIFGDARNNGNQSGIEYLKSIQERSRGVIWLNPEISSNWDTGDSILSHYQPAITQLYSANKTRDLIEFMDNFSIDRLYINRKEH